MASTFIPEAELDKDESKLLADSLAEVSSFYSQTVDPKLVAWLGLLGVAGKIYGPRVGAFLIRRKLEKAPKMQPLPGNAPQPKQNQKPAHSSAPAPQPYDGVILPTE